MTDSPSRLPHWLAGTVRRQLIWGVALVHAVMMSLFVYDLSLRQRDFLIESQTSQAISLAQNLSLIAATPLLSSDFAGLQELTRAIGAYSGVTHVMVLLPNGKVVAHGQASLRGQFLADFDRFGQTVDPQPQLLLRSEALADVVVPVLVQQDRIGWVRVGVSQSATATKLAAITQSGLLYTLLAIGVGVLLAWLLANRLTRRLTALAKVAGDVSAGRAQVRAWVNSTDEVSQLARAFNAMLDALAAQQRKEQDLKEALQAEKELAQVTLASIGDAVITTDAQGLVSFMNEAAIGLTGWPLSQVRGQSVTDFLVFKDGATQDRLINPVTRVMHSGVAAQSGAHTVLVTQQGGLVSVETLATPIFFERGQLLGCVLVLRDVSEREQVQERLQWQAGHDALTGLPNRVLLADRFERALEKSRRDGSQLAVCLLDLDKFKPVNDTYGHAVGDMLLVALTARLNQELRAVDTLTRLGGDEFVILLEDLADDADLTGLLARILQTLAEPFELQGHAIAITGSLGLTVYPADSSDPDTLLRHADQAMYVAKQTGRNRYHRFDVLQDIQQESVQQTLERVRQAITGNELRLYYQPKVNLRSGKVVGFEALLRWQHPQDGMIPPLSFLPLVEQSDVIVAIGEWVIEQALKQLAVWQQQGQVWPVSVNISARHFQQEDFLPRLQILLACHPQVSPSLLEFEILESVALGDMGAMNALIANCRALGIDFSLDDFGTGYSSLSYLKRIPVQTLKIDQSFVRDMLDDADDRALVESIIHIATLFKLSVIAEGVETQDQGVLLLRLGCDVVQGYGIARPMPAEQVFDWACAFVSDPQWCLWADVKWELSDLPLLVAQHDHLAWVKRVVLAAQGLSLGMPQAQLTDPHQCRFGQWYDGHGRQRYGDLPQFQAIAPVHQQIHALGSEVLRLHAAGDAAGAATVSTQLLAQKDQLLKLLDALQQAALMKIRDA
ncbi:EAL domain-containing protein [Rhodoferax sp.]|uniref:EAL domain-containing protein n=2 Tax=Rhodoferax sp. TaxID=50421 RepID=UPI002615F028|nr:EAL domain-containing protein [Rhodoferax sp.]MDD5480071.1 EAL domain-containing protein [Rhodoferax sp.]